MIRETVWDFKNLQTDLFTMEITMTISLEEEENSQIAWDKSMKDNGKTV